MIRKWHQEHPKLELANSLSSVVAYSMQASPEWTVGSAICNGNQTNDTNNKNKEQEKSWMSLKDACVSMLGKGLFMLSFRSKGSSCVRGAPETMWKHSCSCFSSQRGTFAGTPYLILWKAICAWRGSYLRPNYVIRDNSGRCGELGVLGQIALQWFPLNFLAYDDPFPVKTGS